MLEQLATALSMSNARNCQMLRLATAHATRHRGGDVQWRCWRPWDGPCFALKIPECVEQLAFADEAAAQSLKLVASRMRMPGARRVYICHRMSKCSEYHARARHTRPCVLNKSQPAHRLRYCVAPGLEFELWEGDAASSVWHSSSSSLPFWARLRILTYVLFSCTHARTHSHFPPSSRPSPLSSSI